MPIDPVTKIDHEAAKKWAEMVAPHPDADVHLGKHNIARCYLDLTQQLADARALLEPAQRMLMRLGSGGSLERMHAHDIASFLARKGANNG